MPELIGYSEDGTPQYSFSDEDKLKGISVRPYNALLDPAPVAAEQSPLPVDVTGVGAVPNNTTGFTAVDKLFGFNGQERFQTWPERMAREAVAAPHKALTEGFVPGSDEEIGAAQAVASMAGMGSIPMAQKMALGSAGGKLIQPAIVESKAPVFYSALENAVSNITANKMPADQWLGTLTNAKGVRPEEMEWTGLKDFLAEQKGPVTKDQVQQYLDANKVELKEVNKGDLNELPKGYDVVKSSDGQYWNVKSPKGGFIASNFPSETEAKNAAINFLKEANHPNPTKFSKYQLPGGTNYQEKLLTLPIKSGEAGPKGWGDTGGGTLSNANPANFRSSHWDEPNVLAHVRMNDRIIDGKKSLHLEELQSDWLQSGRDKGFALSADKIEKLRPQFDKIDNKLLNSNDEQVLGHPEVDGMLKMAVDKKVITPDEAKIYKQVSDTAQTGAVPDAPFKKTWHELVLKRMLREAAEKGYSRLSWTPGEAQAARYDLSKQIKDLTVTKFDDGKGGHEWLLAGNDLSGKSFQLRREHIISDANLADHIGKDLAERIIKNQKLPGSKKTYSDVDLKIGGEGMKGFYDQIIPRSLEKIGKEHGVKVQQGDLNLNKYEEFRINRKGEQFYVSNKQGEKNGPFGDLRQAQDFIDKQKPKAPIHYIDIPQSLKDQALRKGFPLFSSGVMLSPVEQSPFDNQPKLTLVPHNPFE